MGREEMNRNGSVLNENSSSYKCVILMLEEKTLKVTVSSPRSALHKLFVC